MTPAQLAVSVLAAVQAARAAGTLVVDDAAVPRADEVKVERPKNREHGDYATNIALQLAKPAGRPPREVAAAIAEQLAGVEGVTKVDIAGPGFLNITLDASAQGEVAALVLAAGAAYGRSDTLAGQRVNLEFISANPTGPLHLGHTRWAAVGDAMGRVLEAAGAQVAREFYINDRGIQMDLFGASLAAAAAGRPVPDNGYHGAYIGDLAAEIVAAHPDYLTLPEPARMEAFREAGYALQLAQQQRVLDAFRTHFDVWASERAMHTSGAVERAFARLREQGHVYDADGAVWLRTTDFGDDKDRVLIKADGALTYFASDTAYYVDKRARGFDVCIYLLGADHHGYVNRLRTVAACAGDDPDVNIQVLIGQLVKILKGGEEVKLSKRAGDIVSLEEFVEEVGVDAARYTLCRYPVDSPLTLDIAVMTLQKAENPVFYVQYAHARICSVIRNAADLGSSRPRRLRRRAAGARARGDLLGKLAEFGRVVASAAELRRAAPGRPVPGGAGRDVPPVLRRVPGAAHGRRGRRRTSTARGWCCAPRPGRCWPTASTCSASTRPSGCSRCARTPPGRGTATSCTMPSRSRRRTTSARSTPRSGRRASTATPTASCGWPVTTCVTWPPSSARPRSCSTRPTSGPAATRSATRSPAATSTTRRRRS
jgi:arginyl-tRNA synthetase